VEIPILQSINRLLLSKMGQSFRKPVFHSAPASPHTTGDVSILPSISVPQKQDGCSVVQQANSSTEDNSNFPDSSVTSIQQPVEVFMKTSQRKAFVYDINAVQLKTLEIKRTNLVLLQLIGIFL